MFSGTMAFTSRLTMFFYRPILQDPDYPDMESGRAMAPVAFRSRMITSGLSWKSLMRLSGLHTIGLLPAHKLEGIKAIDLPNIEFKGSHWRRAFRMTRSEPLRKKRHNLKRFRLLRPEHTWKLSFVLFDVGL